MVVLCLSRSIMHAQVNHLGRKTPLLEGAGGFWPSMPRYHLREIDCWHMGPQAKMPLHK
jgi:hypothetical protein